MSALTPESVRKMLDEATPGPWRADDEHGLLPGATPAWVTSRTDTETRDVYLGDVAYVPQGGYSEEADCVLIAAAPDLARAYLTQASALERVQAPLTKTERDLIIETGRHVYGCCSDDCPDHGLPEDAQILAVERILRDRALAGPTPSGDQT